MSVPDCNKIVVLATPSLYNVWHGGYLVKIHEAMPPFEGRDPEHCCAVHALYAVSWCKKMIVLGGWKPEQFSLKVKFPPDKIGPLVKSPRNPAIRKTMRMLKLEAKGFSNPVFCSTQAVGESKQTRPADVPLLDQARGETSSGSREESV